MKAQMKKQKQTARLMKPNTIPFLTRLILFPVALLLAWPSQQFPASATLLQTKKLTASDGGAGNLFGHSVSMSGDVAVVGAVGAVRDQGWAYVFERNRGGTNNWGQLKKLVAIDGEFGDRFGASVSVSGDIIIIGADGDAIGENTYQGSAYVFERNRGGSNNWGQVKKLLASDGTANDSFGASVAASGDTIVVGAYGDDATRGAVYVFERNRGGTNNWGEVKKVVASDGGATDFFGGSVSVSGDMIVVGAALDDLGFNDSQGSAYIFERNQGGTNNWGLVKKLLASDGAQYDTFGNSVSVSGNLIAVGANGDDNSRGSAYVFERNRGGTNQWGEVRKLRAGDGAAFDSFGWSVSLGRDLVVVGANQDSVGANQYQGSAYVFQRHAGGSNNWGQVQMLTTSDGTNSDFFGCSVSMSGDKLVVGAFGDQFGANINQGSAYVFTPPPLLNLVRTNGTVILSWDKSAMGFVLQATESLTVPNWHPVPSGTNGASLPFTGEARFFRLKK